jgi:hypothetical protein
LFLLHTWFEFFVFCFHLFLLLVLLSLFSSLNVFSLSFFPFIFFFLPFFQTFFIFLPYYLGDQMSLWKNRPRYNPTLFCQNLCITLTVSPSSQKCRLLM